MPKKPSPALVVALLALFVALGGPAEAAKLLSGSKLKPNSVTSKQIRQRTITSRDIARSTLRSLKARTNAVGSAQIVDGSVSLADMAFGSVTGNQVIDRSLTGVDLAADSVGAGELGTDSVTTAELADDAVTNREIRTGAVTKGSIGNSDVGTEEVIDRSLTGVDIARASGTLTATSFGAVTGNTPCVTQDFPATGVAGTAIAVSAPADGLDVTARPVDDATIRLQACNPGPVGSTLNGNGDYRFVAIAP